MALGDPISFRELQIRVGNWNKRFFDHRKGCTQKERILRVFEEAVELCQAGDITLEEIQAQLKWTYNRPKGPIYEEMQGIMIGMCALAEVMGVDLHTMTSVELQKIDTPEMYKKMQVKVNRKIEAGISSCDLNPE